MKRSRDVESLSFYLLVTIVVGVAAIVMLPVLSGVLHAFASIADALHVIDTR